MDPTTIKLSTFILSGVTGTVSYDSGSRTATFTPSTSLAYNTSYTVMITTGARDAIGNSLSSNYTWSFTTGAISTYTPGDYYVDIAYGVDSPAQGGSSGSGAWKTLHYAVSRINTGLPGTYILHVASGTYNETNGEGSDPILINQSNFTIIGGGPTKPKIEGNHGAWAPAFTITNVAQNVTIENLEITGFDTAAIKCRRRAIRDDPRTIIFIKTAGEF